MFGLGFTEILIIAVIAILFLGPDKLPSTMINIAKFFKNVKKTVGDVKDSIEQEMNVSEMKQEALAYKKELLKTKTDITKATDLGDIGPSLTSLNSDFMDDYLNDDDNEDKPKKEIIEKKETVEKINQQEPEKITFEKKSKEKDNTDV